jgi:hypothetical protein
MVKDASAHHENEFDEFFFETGTHKIQGVRTPLEIHIFLHQGLTASGG